MRLLPTIAAMAALAVAGSALAQPAGGGQPGPGGPAGGSGGVRAACAADMQKFCPDAQGPARRECMQSHQNDLSAECKAALAEMRARMQQGGGGPPPSSAPPGGGQ
jgi:hypothetical protein